MTNTHRRLQADLTRAHAAKQAADHALFAVSRAIAESAIHDGWLPSMATRRDYAAKLTAAEAAATAMAEHVTVVAR